MMTEEAAVSKAIAIIDDLLEQAEATLLRLDVNQTTFERTGKFAKNKKKQYDLCFLNRFPNNAMIAATKNECQSSESKTLISSGATSPPSSKKSLSSTSNNSTTTIGQRLKMDPSIRRLYPEGSYETLAQSSLSSSVSIKSDKKKKNKKTKRPMTLAPIPSFPSRSRLSPSIVSPVSSKYSLQTLPQPTKSDSFTSSRMSSSVVTGDDETTEATTTTHLQSMLPEKARSTTTLSSKNNYKTAPSESATEFAFDFNAVMKDRKSGKSYPLKVSAKCLEGDSARVYINGKAFGPCQE
uniref:Uncharacterized protein n=1 Tax=Panagrolaimus davidi TaxID=227884 RepID=A0A914QBE2_9BILA